MVARWSLQCACGPVGAGQRCGASGAGQRCGASGAGQRCRPAVQAGGAGAVGLLFPAAARGWVWRVDCCEG